MFGYLRRCMGAVAVLGITLLSGCYSLVPINVETVTPPVRVRAYLSPAGTERVAPMLGSARSAFNGKLVEVSSEGLYIEVPSARVQAGMRTETLTQKLLIPRDHLAGLQRRELDRTRTYLVIGAGAATAGLLIFEALSGAFGESVGRPPGGGGSEARIPVWSFPLR